MKHKTAKVFLEYILEPNSQSIKAEQRVVLDSDRSNNRLDTRLIESLYPDILGIIERNCLGKTHLKCH
jgi:hypothetical protein